MRQPNDQAIAGGADAGDVARVPALVSRETDDVGSVSGIGSGCVPARRQGAFDDVAEGPGGHRFAGGRREAKAAPDADRVARTVLRDARHPARDLGDDPRGRRAGGVGVVVEIGARGVGNLHVREGDERERGIERAGIVPDGDARDAAGRCRDVRRGRLHADPQPPVDRRERGGTVSNVQGGRDVIGARVDFRQGPVAAVGHPQRVAGDGQCARRVADGDFGDDAVGAGVDARDPVGKALGDPHRPIADGERAGPGAGWDRVADHTVALDL